ncbi:MAG: GDSL-type esterase/lipase family protein [Victivallaceae bacterium]|nr:GDSL-type esterase/lipase family protein [Victivallaceae bacterium]
MARRIGFLGSMIVAVSLFFVSGVVASDIVLCGDSIMADYSRRDPRPCFGWGEFISGYCAKGVEVRNLAVPGSSTKTWLDKGLWGRAVSNLEAGDCVFIAFGNNDSDKGNPSAYVCEADFQSNLKRMVGEVREAGAVPVLLTTTSTYDADAATLARKASYNDAIRRVAADGNVPLLDLNVEFLVAMESDNGGASYFVLKREVPVRNWLDYDKVHLNRNGAEMTAGLVVKLVKKSGGRPAALFR